jgi:hypothetical protein
VRGVWGLILLQIETGRYRVPVQTNYRDNRHHKEEEREHQKMDIKRQMEDNSGKQQIGSTAR